MKKLIKIFRVRNYQQLAVVFLVFAITGSMSVILANPLLLFFFGPDIQSNELYWLFRLFIIFPIYQFLLIFIGSLFGEFRYFWEIERKILVRLGVLKSPRG